MARSGPSADLLASFKGRRVVDVPADAMDGMIVSQTPPQYPAAAKSLGVQGTVVLKATISKLGYIQNLSVISGPPVLQQAALDTVSKWRYRPYLSNEQPVEVHTSISVIFRLPAEDFKVQPAPSSQK